MRVGNMCQTVTRIDFLNGDYSRPVKHIVIDEAQSFQSKDGDWYGKAVRLTAVDPCKPDVLWIFLDYLQTSHSKDSGLPDASKQEPQEWLTTGVRNATQVYNVMMHVTEMIANDRSEHVKKLADILGHDNSQMFSGAVHVCAAVIELLQEKLRSPVEPDILYDQLKCLQAEIQPGNTMEVWYPNYFCGLVSKSDLHNFRLESNLYNSMLEFRKTMLCFPHRTEILYEQLKKLVDDPQDDHAVEALGIVQICIIMMEFMQETLYFPRRLQLFWEKFERFFNEVKSWMQVKAESEHYLPTLDLPYKQLNRLVDEAHCGHSLQGVFDMRVFKDKDEIVTVTVHKCLEYFEKGYSSKNIAILCSSVEERDSYKGFLECEMSNHMTESRLNVCFTTTDVTEGNGIVVDSIHHFSGLERSIVFAIFPDAEREFLIPHLFVCMVSRANLHCHVLLDQSKGFCYFASTIENQGILLKESSFS